MTTLVKRSGLALGAVALVVATAAVTTVVIGTAAQAARDPLASYATKSSFPAVPYSSKSASARAASSQRYREVTLPAGPRVQLRPGSGYSSENNHDEQRIRPWAMACS